MSVEGFFTGHLFANTLWPQLIRYVATAYLHQQVADPHVLAIRGIQLGRSLKSPPCSQNLEFCQGCRCLFCPLFQDSQNFRTVTSEMLNQARQPAHANERALRPLKLFCVFAATAQIRYASPKVKIRFLGYLSSVLHRMSPGFKTLYSTYGGPGGLRASSSSVKLQGSSGQRRQTYSARMKPVPRR